MLNKYKESRSKLKEKTIANVKKQKYFNIIFLNFIIFFFTGEVVDIFSAVIQSNWKFYFSWTRFFDSLGLYIVGSIIFTILIVKKYSIIKK